MGCWISDAPKFPSKTLRVGDTCKPGFSGHRKGFCQSRRTRHFLRNTLESRLQMQVVERGLRLPSCPAHPRAGLGAMQMGGQRGRGQGRQTGTRSGHGEPSQGFTLIPGPGQAESHQPAECGRGTSRKLRVSCSARPPAPRQDTLLGGGSIVWEQRRTPAPTPSCKCQPPLFLATPACFPRAELGALPEWKRPMNHTTAGSQGLNLAEPRSLCPGVGGTARLRGDSRTCPFLRTPWGHTRPATHSPRPRAHRDSPQRGPCRSCLYSAPCLFKRRLPLKSDLKSQDWVCS